MHGQRHGWFDFDLLLGRSVDAMSRLLLASVVSGALLFLAGTSARNTTSAQTTGDPIEQILSALLARDVDSVVAHVARLPVGCGQEATVGSPPTCVPGAAPGSPVDVFSVVGCEGTFVDTEAGIRNLFSTVLSRSQSWSLYRVIRTREASTGRDVALLALNEGAVPDANQHGILIVVDGAGHVTGLITGCANSLGSMVSALPATGSGSVSRADWRFGWRVAGLLLVSIGAATAGLAMLALRPQKEPGV